MNAHASDARQLPSTHETQHAAQPPPPPSPKKTSIGTIEIVLTLVAPSVIFAVLSGRPGMAAWQAYGWSIVPVAVFMLNGLIRHRQWGYFATPVLIGMVAQLLVAYYCRDDFRITNSAIALPVLAVGIMWIASVTVMERNAIAGMSRRGHGNSPEGIEAADREWNSPGYKWVTSRISWVWGLGYIAQTVVLVAGAFAVSESAFQILQLVVTIGAPALLGIWTYLYVQYLIRLRDRKLSAEAPAV
ncbi:hypothetical protein HDU77_002431 [Chytriomyces hyalinus]|nr:hypothetical protein HDU77_002431 [Chytriomyces hyalinus]